MAAHSPREAGQSQTLNSNIAQYAGKQVSVAGEIDDKVGGTGEPRA
jgi:hypothetical protein